MRRLGLSVPLYGDSLAAWIGSFLATVVRGGRRRLLNRFDNRVGGACGTTRESGPLPQTRWMSAPYNQFAGRSMDRVTALSDGVFAVAMTLLVLDLRVPIGIAHTDRHLWDALTKLGPSAAAYLLSFTMLGTF